MNLSSIGGAGAGADRSSMATRAGYGGQQPARRQDTFELNWDNPLITGPQGRTAKAQVLDLSGRPFAGASAFEIEVDGYDQAENNEVEFIINPSRHALQSAHYALYSEAQQQQQQRQPGVGGGAAGAGVAGEADGAVNGVMSVATTAALRRLNSGQGDIGVSCGLRLPKGAVQHHGWLEKQNPSQVGLGGLGGRLGFQRRLFMLTETELIYVENKRDVNARRIALREVALVVKDDKKEPLQFTITLDQSLAVSQRPPYVLRARSAPVQNLRSAVRK